MADLASLMKIAPNTGSMFMGQQFGQETQQRDLEQQQLAQQIRDLQQANDFNAQKQPGLLEHQRLQNSGLQAGLAGITADSSKKQSAASLAAGTLNTDIAAGNDKNITGIEENKVKLYKDKQEAFHKAGMFISGLPPMLRTQAGAEALKQLGVDPNSSQGQLLLSNPETMGKSFTDLADHIGKMAEAESATSRTTKSEGALNRKNQLDIHAGNNAATIRAAEIGAASREKIAGAKTGNAAKTIEQAVVQGKLNYEKAAVAYSTLALTEDDEVKKKLLLATAAKYEKAAKDKAAAGSQGKPDASGMGIPVQQQSPSILGGDNPQTAPPAGRAPPQAVMMLKQNPALAAAFDSKYGPGASKAALAQ